MRRWLAPAALAAVALTSGSLALRPEASPAEAAGGRVAPAAPVLSARRVPSLVAGLVAGARLRAGLDASLDDPSLAGGRERSCLLVRRQGRVLYSRRPEERLLPASNLKILTATAVLAKLGRDGRLTTEVKASRPPVAGVVDGSLWLVGGGDPLLATADYAASFANQPQVYSPLESLADRVVAAGVRQVTGGVVGDESRYDTERYVPTWKPGYLTDSESGPASSLTVNDGFTQFRPKKMLAAPAPATHAAAVFTNLLRARGVAVGEPSEGQAPAKAAEIASLPSLSIEQIVGQMLRESDNLTSELLVKELGHRFGGEGTWKAGLAVVDEALEDAGVDADQVDAVDGSGLDRSDRATCAVLMAALVKDGPRGPVAAGLPVAGRDGTLVKRFVGHPAAGRLRAKTGSLDGVAALTGWLDMTEGEPLAFALVANDLPRDALGRSLQERVAAVLAAYPEAPDEMAIGPPPPSRRQ